MTAPARLLSVRLQGFKSFAERTQVTFGPGISAVVGPNGSGKSNLADALRWALGEQGRALRSRKAEDVIWAGSERRPAVGMADVQLTLDNADGLLPVEYGVVELGRRLYRSGENEYLLNRQRVRLRDLVDLLDSAHLAENAFLFIGQGMVDQALALRPEERRPLFEEVAGVRRHERRRRRAEEQLTESESNLARVEDILAELRPQARRLAAQAEQQATRVSAGDRLAEALLVAAHARWHEATARIDGGAAALSLARAEVDAALGELAAAESAAAMITAALGERGAVATNLRQRADEAAAALTAAQLRGGRLDSEASAIAGERARLAAERAAAEADLVVQRRRLAEPVPARDLEAEAALSAAERALSDALAELAALQAATRARDEDLVALRRAAAARAAEVETAERRLADAMRTAEAESSRAAEVAQRLAAAEATLATVSAELETATSAEGAAAEARRAAQDMLDQRTAAATTAAERASLSAATLAGLKAERAALAAAVADDATSSVAARLRGRGRRIDEDLVVEPGLRAAVGAALADAARAYLTTRGRLVELAGERGVVVVADEGNDEGGSSGDAGSVPSGDAAGRAFIARVASAGGGLLVDGLRRDRTGAVRRLLSRAAWVPDLAAAVALQSHLPAGWILVPRDGSAVIGEVVVRLGRGDGILEGQAELERVGAAAGAAEAAAMASAAAAADAAAAAAAAGEALEAARAAEAAAAGRRRAAEESERVAARDREALVREAGWQAAQALRLAGEVERARAAVATMTPFTPASVSAEATTSPEADAAATWGERAAELRARRDRLLAVVTEVDGARREGERRRAASEASIALDEARMAATDVAVGRLAEREAVLAAERTAHASALADAGVRASEARAALDDLIAADTADRTRLGAAEAASRGAGERLRSAEERSRAAERRDLEARLGRDALREQMLVELAGLGRLGLRHLQAASGAFALPGPAVEGALEPDGAVVVDDEAGIARDADVDEADALATALDAAGERWAVTPPAAEAPGPGRLGALRRRYHELGASNPFAVDEYATLRSRLDELEHQHGDLRMAIARTRTLIAELDTLIARQFRTTFEALEAAFDARFRQLFGGGFARLSLTDPGDLAVTGVEIVARPPGKKAQALAMLSGGERALTAVALLFAMLEVRPVPFCVLDEVDAALDESNVGRFTDALRELAERTQFVVITHNRGTIEIADALYGVTVGDDPVSRVISLRLDEATELAERRASPVAVGPA